MVSPEPKATVKVEDPLFAKELAFRLKKQGQPSGQYQYPSMLARRTAEKSIILAQIHSKRVGEFR